MSCNCEEPCPRGGLGKWRAQAQAIAHVAYLREPNAVRRDAYLAKAMTFADTLEARAAR